jgi:hypothetical protein
MKLVKQVAEAVEAKQEKDAGDWMNRNLLYAPIITRGLSLWHGFDAVCAPCLC